MREIKFRAWDLNEKVFASFLDINISSKNKVPTEFGFVEDGSLIFMQYTGLKDKNGKEIYEGDILKVSKDLYKWFPETRERDYTIVEVKYLICTFNPLEVIFGVAGSDSVEIIGNIYENPELLKD